MTRRYSSISVQTTLANSISNTALSVTVAVATGSTLMGGVALAGGNVDQYKIYIDPDTASAEIMYVTGVSGDILTVLRGQDGTSAIAHNSGAIIKHVLTGEDLTYLTTGVVPTSNLTVGLPFPGSTSGTNTVKALAIAGTVVTTLPASTDTLVGQATTDTLTNKTLTNPIIDFPILGFATQATAASTLTLTIASKRKQEFTGTTPGQIVQLPVVSTLPVAGGGGDFLISNKSTQTIAVNSSGSNLVFTVPANTDWIFTFNGTAGTAAASWSNSYTGSSAAPASVSTTLLGLTNVQSTKFTQLDGNGYEMDLFLLVLAGAI